MQQKLTVSLLSYTPDPEKIISAAAKLCYSKSNIEDIMSGLENNEWDNYLNMLMEMGHTSPVEHVSFSFGIEGVSRSLTHQLVRHRVASYSQKSQRYVTEGQFRYIVPPAIEEDKEAMNLFIKTMEIEQNAYDSLVKILKDKHYKNYIIENIDDKKARSMAEKRAIEDARYVLPNACETKIIATMNARELLHFFNHRCCQRAQWEIRELAFQMLIIVRKIAPTLFKYAGPNCIKGPCPEGTMTCGEITKVRKKYSN